MWWKRHLRRYRWTPAWERKDLCRGPWFRSHRVVAEKIRNQALRAAKIDRAWDHRTGKMSVREP